MSERLTDEALIRLAGRDLYDGAEDDVADAIAELRERRAADLTAEDREALAWIRCDIKATHEPWHTSDHAAYQRALAILDRLLAAEPKETCTVSPVSSRACERGTKGCETRHRP